MLAGSFRVVAARLIPPGVRAKQAALLLAPVILAACGGSSAAKVPQQQVVAGPGFRFEAPTGWRVERGPRQATASDGSELVKVATFPLLKPYTAALFNRVDRELSTRMRQVAQQTGGKLSSPATVTAGGIRSHAYRVTTGDNVDQYTFVLRGKREYQLLCRRAASHDDSVCARLIASFRAL
jgi:hypothetical protein